MAANKIAKAGLYRRCKCKSLITAMRALFDSLAGVTPQGSGQGGRWEGRGHVIQGAELVGVCISCS